MKRVIVLLTCLALMPFVFTLVGCGGPKLEKANDKSPEELKAAAKEILDKQEKDRAK